MVASSSVLRAGRLAVEGTKTTLVRVAPESGSGGELDVSTDSACALNAASKRASSASAVEDSDAELDAADAAGDVSATLLLVATGSSARACETATVESIVARV